MDRDPAPWWHLTFWMAAAALAFIIIGNGLFNQPPIPSKYQQRLLPNQEVN